MPMNATLRTGRRARASTTCATISALPSWRRSPSRPVMQNPQPTAQPTCVDTHTPSRGAARSRRSGRRRVRRRAGASRLRPGAPRAPGRAHRARRRAPAGRRARPPAGTRREAWGRSRAAARASRRAGSRPRARASPPPRAAARAARRACAGGAAATRCRRMREPESPAVSRGAGRGMMDSKVAGRRSDRRAARWRTASTARDGRAGVAVARRRARCPAAAHSARSAGPCARRGSRSPGWGVSAARDAEGRAWHPATWSSLPGSGWSSGSRRTSPTRSSRHPAPSCPPACRRAPRGSRRFPASST